MRCRAAGRAAPPRSRPTRAASRRDGARKLHLSDVDSVEARFEVFDHAGLPVGRRAAAAPYLPTPGHSRVVEQEGPLRRQHSDMPRPARRAATGTHQNLNDDVLAGEGDISDDPRDQGPDFEEDSEDDSSEEELDDQSSSASDKGRSSSSSDDDNSSSSDDDSSSSSDDYNGVVKRRKLETEPDKAPAAPPAPAPTEMSIDDANISTAQTTPPADQPSAHITDATPQTTPLQAAGFDGDDGAEPSRRASMILDLPFMPPRQSDPYTVVTSEPKKGDPVTMQFLMQSRQNRDEEQEKILEDLVVVSIRGKTLSVMLTQPANDAFVTVTFVDDYGHATEMEHFLKEEVSIISGGGTSEVVAQCRAASQQQPPPRIEEPEQTPSAAAPSLNSASETSAQQPAPARET